MGLVMAEKVENHHQVKQKSKLGAMLIKSIENNILSTLCFII